MESKICSECGIEQPLSNFRHYKRKCNSCESKRHLRYMHEHPEKEKCIRKQD